MALSAAAAPRAPSSAAVRLAALLVAVWLLASAQVLWHFERQRLDQSRQLLHFSVDGLPPAPLAAPAGVAKVLYFLDRGCPCNTAALAEVARLQRAGFMPAARFVAGAASAADLGASELSASERAAWRGHIPAAPAAALWNARGELVYFGPINASAGCGDGASYLKDALRRMRTDSSAVFSSWDAVTCACPAAQSVHS